MKTESKEKKPATKNSNSNKGLAEFIQGLHAKGLAKEAAYAQALEKYPLCSARIHFDARWKTAEKRTKAAVKAEAKAKEAKTETKK